MSLCSSYCIYRQSLRFKSKHLLHGFSTSIYSKFTRILFYQVFQRQLLMGVHLDPPAHPPTQKNEVSPVMIIPVCEVTPPNLQLSGCEQGAEPCGHRIHHLSDLIQCSRFLYFSHMTKGSTSWVLQYMNQRYGLDST